jgi:hypothetical protein
MAWVASWRITRARGDLSANLRIELVHHGYAGLDEQAIRADELLDNPAGSVILKASALGESKPTARRAGWCVRPGRTVRPRVKSKSDRYRCEASRIAYPGFDPIAASTLVKRQTPGTER